MDKGENKMIHIESAIKAYVDRCEYRRKNDCQRSGWEACIKNKCPFVTRFEETMMRLEVERKYDRECVHCGRQYDVRESEADNADSFCCKACENGY